uniref:Uncharacterized protein n=1 Tax=Leptocylindrus danicus TaxID=163516 RepID=A0A7S2LGP4_9STRA|mmetsp:Transcript_4627/g.6772  ORF Transcript_4627/g.6772 Transcript_4627/m.6772 type:complete len:788 (+) Transcript_4627:61-2424(+)
MTKKSSKDEDSNSIMNQLKKLAQEIKLHHQDEAQTLTNLISSIQAENNAAFNDEGENAEMASRLAEGAIHRLRDLALDEAAELHEALRFWSNRYERPVLSFLESGPGIILSEKGYNHAHTGLKVSQIQAVLARRCAAVGELQQHLLRAGWTRGVAQWGVLGQGEQWVKTGADGFMEDRSVHTSNETNAMTTTPIIKKQSTARNIMTRSKSGHELLEHSNIIGATTPGSIVRKKSNRRQRQQQQSRKNNAGNAMYMHTDTNIVVGNTRGGRIITSPPALVAWSVDAVRVIRDQLYRAGNFNMEVPYAENWPREEYYMHGREPSSHDMDRDHVLPLWATMDSSRPCSSSASNGNRALLESYSNANNLDDLNTSVEADEVASNGSSSNHHQLTTLNNKTNLAISNLVLMSEEVNELLNEIDVQMAEQRKRRLEKLRPPSRWKRNWYFAALGAPVAGYVVYTLAKDNWGIILLKHVLSKMKSFYAEHVYEPLTDIFTELFTSKARQTITDQAAGEEIENSLKNMLKAWLDDQYPHTDEAWRANMANNMDMSLIEKKKEDNVLNALKSTFTGDIIRMGLIEVQFIKKELMHAMKGIDEVMDSNELNFQLAATAPALMLMYAAREFAHFFFYALLKLGQSKEETYASFRYLMLEIERLLVMRDSALLVPPPLKDGITVAGNNRTENLRRRGMSFDESEDLLEESDVVMLNTNDLGMLVLLVHECRTLILKNKRRFSDQEIRNVLEDLAELSGERGCVSVKQQLEIVSRMSRVYSFMKVVSTGIPFDVSHLVTG